MLKLWILTWYMDSYEIQDSYQRTYFRMYKRFLEKWIELRRISYHHFDDDLWTFNNSAVISETWIDIIDDGRQPDVIRNRISDVPQYIEDAIYSKYKSMGEQRYTRISVDKYEQYNYIRELQAKTYLLKDFMKEKYVQNDLSKDIVLKPTRAYGGSGIEFLTKEELLESCPIDSLYWNQYVVQEYKDFSWWVPWLVNGMHDVRLYFFWSELIDANIRQPATWSKKSNIALWWSWTHLPVQDVPWVLLGTSETVRTKINISDSQFYCIDYGYVLSEEKWYVFEVNNSPWMFYPEECLEQEYVFHNRIISCIHKSFST